MTVPVLAAPLLDPGCGRVRVELPEGSTIAQIVAVVFPAWTRPTGIRCVRSGLRRRRHGGVA